MKFIILLFSIVAICSADFISDCIDTHNGYRSQFGEEGLRWADDLAGSSQDWANHLAGSGQFEHSGAGENLAMGTAGAYSAGDFINMWGNEGQHFIQDCTFPDCSHTGNWADVGHFTQMIWRGTQEVGCALASGNGNDVLVCHYRPVGNYNGQRVY